MLLKRQVARLQPSFYLGIFLLLIVACGVLLYYLNAPFVEYGPDTPGYLIAAQQIRTTGIPVNYFRLPTYPFFILLIDAVAGQGNLMAVSIVQGILFVCAVGEIYFLTLLITRRMWIAFFVGLWVGTNIVLLYNAKLIMTEGLSLWLLTTLILCAVVFLKTLRPIFFWASFACLLLLLFTRPEWILFPLLLFLYIIVYTRKKLSKRAIVLPVISALVVIYLLVGAYIYANDKLNHIASLSSVTNMNFIGKVIQYRMQDETPYNPYFSHIYDYYINQGQYSPYYIMNRVPTLGAAYAHAPAKWAEGIILHHPVEFLVKSVPYFFTSLYYNPPSSYPNIAHGEFVNIIKFILQVHLYLFTIDLLFPLCALVWIILCCYRKTRHIFGVQIMGLLVLTVLYGVIITTLGGYSPNDYVRTHVVFDPLITLIVWGTFGLGIYQLGSFIRRRKQVSKARVAFDPRPEEFSQTVEQQANTAS